MNLIDLVETKTRYRAQPGVPAGVAQLDNPDSYGITDSQRKKIGQIDLDRLDAENSKGLANEPAVSTVVAEKKKQKNRPSLQDRLQEATAELIDADDTVGPLRNKLNKYRDNDPINYEGDVDPAAPHDSDAPGLEDFYTQMQDPVSAGARFDKNFAGDFPEYSERMLEALNLELLTVLDGIVKQTSVDQPANDSTDSTYLDLKVQMKDPISPGSVGFHNLGQPIDDMIPWEGPENNLNDNVRDTGDVLAAGDAALAKIRKIDEWVEEIYESTEEPVVEFVDGGKKVNFIKSKRMQDLLSRKYPGLDPNEAILAYISDEDDDDESVHRELRKQNDQAVGAVDKLQQRLNLSRKREDELAKLLDIEKEENMAREIRFEKFKKLARDRALDKETQQKILSMVDQQMGQYKQDADVLKQNSSALKQKLESLTKVADEVKQLEAKIKALPLDPKQLEKLTAKVQEIAQMQAERSSKLQKLEAENDELESEIEKQQKINQEQQQRLEQERETNEIQTLQIDKLQNSALELNPNRPKFPDEKIKNLYATWYGKNDWVNIDGEAHDKALDKIHNMIMNQANTVATEIKNQRHLSDKDRQNLVDQKTKAMKKKLSVDIGIRSDLTNSLIKAFSAELDRVLGQDSYIPETTKNLKEGVMKNMLWDLAERMDRDQFIEYTTTEMGLDAEEMGEFWDAIFGDINEAKKSNKVRPRNPVAKAAQRVAKGAGQHKSARQYQRQPKHRKKHD